MARVLVVDDCQTVVDSVRAALEPLGHDVRGVVLLAGLVPALRWEPHVVLLDLEMPGAQAIRFRDLLAGRPVCVYSARPREELQARARDVGAVAWLEKGRPLTQLRHAIEALLRRASGRRPR